MRVFCEEQGFDFECSSSTDLAGILHASQGQRDWLNERERREDESEQQPWYLDADGERLPPEVLFERSPWSIETASGKVKVLLRLFDHGTREARFDLPDAYLGEWFAWMREKSDDERPR